MDAMGTASSEPSMEEILASIKRIIADDEPGAFARSRPLRAVPEAEVEDAPEEALIEPPHEDVLELHEPIAEAPQPAPAPQPAAAPVDPILSDRVAEASREKLEALSRLIVRPQVPGSDTLEGLVREMLKPMLRDWLDQNLPQLVEQIVAREIARITGTR
jgi:cell pole-organizing protein PopZ